MDSSFKRIRLLCTCKPGKKHLDADALSRCPLSPSHSACVTPPAKALPLAPVSSIAVGEYFQLKKIQQEDHYCQSMVDRLSGRTQPPNSRLRRQQKKFGLLMACCIVKINTLQEKSGFPLYPGHCSRNFWRPFMTMRPLATSDIRKRMTTSEPVSFGVACPQAYPSTARPVPPARIASAFHHLQLYSYNLSLAPLSL